MSDTIAAIATGGVISAIGIVRVSGDDTIAIMDKVFRPSNGKLMSMSPDRSLVFGELVDAKGAVIDICLCTISRAPGSYTGENTAELQCHGSPVVLRDALEALFAAGARQALAGEFTRRAFLNGRMDLTMAEAVIDLIEAETSEAARNAAGQLGGAVSRKTEAVYERLVGLTAHYQAIVDYPEEDIEPLEIEEYAAGLDSASLELRRLLDSYGRGSLMQSGIPATIIGRPTTGKSSLPNALLGYERAIVTEIPGTTRDTLNERVTIGGQLLRLTDTAGLRRSADYVEQLGVSRALEAARSASLILAVFDGSAALHPEDSEVIAAAQDAGHRIAVINKCDLPCIIDLSELSPHFDRVCKLSAMTGDGLDVLSELVRELYPAPEHSTAGEILTNARHAEAVSRTLSALDSARDAMRDGMPPDAVLTEAEAAMSALGELSGKSVREDVTTRIFERFCVGK